MAWASSPTTVRSRPPGQSISQDLRLQAVGVLVFVHEHAGEAVADGARGAGVGEQTVPEEQEVVVVEDALLPLAIDVGREQAAQVLHIVPAPGEMRLHGLFHRLAGVDAAAVDVHAGALEGKAPVVLVEAEFGAQYAHEVFGVAAVEDGEGGLQAYRPAVQAEEACGRGVEGASPHSAAGGAGGARAALGFELAQYPVHAAQHLGRGAPGEGQQQDVSGIGAGRDLVGDAMGQSGRLPGARTGDDEQGLVPVRGRRALLFVQLLEHGPDRGDRSRFGITSQCNLPDSSFASAGSRPTARWAARPRAGACGKSHQGYRSVRTDDRRRRSGAVRRPSGRRLSEPAAVFEEAAPLRSSPGRRRRPPRDRSP